MTLHKKQLITQATVKGSGIDAADRVCKTVRRAAKGLANRARVNVTPTGPIKVAGSEIIGSTERVIVERTMVITAIA